MPVHFFRPKCQQLNSLLPAATMPPLPDLASLCEYPAGLNGSAARFERPCGDTAANNNNNNSGGGGDPAPPCPSATRAHDRRRAAAARQEEAEEEERPTPPAGRVTRSRAGRNGRRSVNGKCPLLVPLFGFLRNFRGQFAPIRWDRKSIDPAAFVRCKEPCLSTA